jgi:hypothetical protein
LIFLSHLGVEGEARLADPLRAADFLVACTLREKGVGEDGGEYEESWSCRIPLRFGALGGIGDTLADEGRSGVNGTSINGERGAGEGGEEYESLIKRSTSRSGVLGGVAAELEDEASSGVPGDGTIG